MWHPDSFYLSQQHTATQLPVNAYFNESLLQLEINNLFNKWPQYSGHNLLVPNMHDYYVLPHHDNGIVLVHGKKGLCLISNICKHRQATIMKAHGNAKRLSCPLHRWTYDDSGKLIAAPRFTSTPCAQLELFNLNQWNGLIFTGDSRILDEVKNIPPHIQNLLTLSDYKFSHTEIHECNYNWKNFIEFYLEDYHVAPFHPGLGHFVSCSNVNWDFGGNCSTQTVPLHNELKNPGDSDIYKQWHQAVLRYYNKKLPDIGAMWVLIYPNVMIEWYPMLIVISTVYPNGPLKCKNIVEYYHPKALDNITDGKSMATLAASAYLETAIEDNEIGERMQEGRFALMRRGVSEYGPYHPNLEAGMRHFHQFLRGIEGISYSMSY